MNQLPPTNQRIFHGTLKVAACQMDVNPAPTPSRLVRARELAAGAAQAGAQLLVLPELFNTGYVYSDENHLRAEPMDGPTINWMKSTAADCHIHLAGSLMLLDGGEIYNALLLVAPDGRLWRYDKNYPWGWERGYFRGGRDITIAHTELGDIGMLICWDCAHADLWRRYAGQVDLMVIASCPPDISNPIYELPDGRRITNSPKGLLMANMQDIVRRAFVDNLEMQTAWLGVPVVHAMACGHFRSPVPRGTLSLLFFLPAAPGLARYLPQANKAQLACDLPSECKILDTSGGTLSRLAQEEGEAYTLAEVTLAEEKPQPKKPPPRPPIPRVAFVIADAALPRLMLPIYRQGLRRIKKS